jgi:AraC-like DNA-binding protein
MSATPAGCWQTATFDERDQDEAWRGMLNRVYGPWEAVDPVRPNFHARVLHHAVGNFQIVNCVCDPCAAVHRPARFSTDRRDTLTLQLVLAGREHFTIDDRTDILGPGDILIWNTTRPMRFEVVERLHKISVTMPLARLRAWLPCAWRSITSRLPGDSNAAGIVSSFINSVSPEFLSGRLQNGDALTEAVLGTLISVLDVPDVVPQDDLREAHWLRVTRYIDANLDDGALSPAGIAAANRISVRYLHSLFQPKGTTVLQHIIRQRLIRCQRELGNPSMARRSITDIAFSWGFHNATHFSRRFKDEFGMSPSEFRNEVAAGNGRRHS